MKIHIGTSGYAYKEWKGKFYPEKVSSGEMLRFYSERLHTVEINNTFYRMPTEDVLSSWAEQVPDGFVFAFKAPRVITHLKRLRNVSEEVGYLFRTLSALGGKLGPVLFQFPGSFRADHAALKDFFALISDVSCAFEFRHPSWLDLEIQDLLRERGHSLCIADTDENPANEIITTASWGYLRLRRLDYSDADLSEWMGRILSQKWERAFVYFKHEEEAKGPQTALRLRKFTESGLKKLQDRKKMK
jgi:uncharacterized protein YecE (DUF72 family)